jgi:hypothetical protein
MRRLIFTALLLTGCYDCPKWPDCPKCPDQTGDLASLGHFDPQTEYEACDKEIYEALRKERKRVYDYTCLVDAKYEMFEQYFKQRESEELKARAQRIDELEKKVVELKMQNYDLLRLVPQKVEENEGR